MIPVQKYFISFIALSSYWFNFSNSAFSEEKKSQRISGVSGKLSSGIYAKKFREGNPYSSAKLSFLPQNIKPFRGFLSIGLEKNNADTKLDLLDALMVRSLEKCDKFAVGFGRQGIGASSKTKETDKILSGLSVIESHLSSIELRERGLLVGNMTDPYVTSKLNGDHCIRNTPVFHYRIDARKYADLGFDLRIEDEIGKGVTLHIEAYFFTRKINHKREPMAYFGIGMDYTLEPNQSLLNGEFIVFHDPVLTESEFVLGNGNRPIGHGFELNFESLAATRDTFFDAYAVQFSFLRPNNLVSHLQTRALVIGVKSHIENLLWRNSFVYSEHNSEENKDSFSLEESGLKTELTLTF